MSERRHPGDGAERPRRTRERGQVASDDPDVLSDLEARLARLEKTRGRRDRGRRFMARVVPDEAAHHFRNAGRAHLLGVRSIVDFWIERIDEPEEMPSGRARHESISID